MEEEEEENMKDEVEMKLRRWKRRKKGRCIHRLCCMVLKPMIFSISDGIELMINGEQGIQCNRLA